MPAPTFDFDLFGSGETLHARKDNFLSHMNTTLSDLWTDLATNIGKFYRNRDEAVNTGQENIPAAFRLISTIESGVWTLRGPGQTEDQLFSTYPNWGVLYRFYPGDWSQEVADAVANSGKVFGSRALAVAEGQENLPPQINVVLVREGNYLEFRGAGSTNDALFPEYPNWGVLARFPDSVLFDAEVADRITADNAVGIIPLVNATAVVEPDESATRIDAEISPTVLALGGNIVGGSTVRIFLPTTLVGNLSLQVAGDVERSLMNERNSTQLTGDDLTGGASVFLDRRGGNWCVISGAVGTDEFNDLATRNLVLSRDGAIIPTEIVEGSTGDNIILETAPSFTGNGLIIPLQTKFTKMEYRPEETNAGANPTLVIDGQGPYAVRDLDGNDWPAEGFVIGRHYFLHRLGQTVRVMFDTGSSTGGNTGNANPLNTDAGFKIEDLHGQVTFRHDAEGTHLAGVDGTVEDHLIKMDVRSIRPTVRADDLDISAAYELTEGAAKAVNKGLMARGGRSAPMPTFCIPQPGDWGKNWLANVQVPITPESPRIITDPMYQRNVGFDEFVHPHVIHFPHGWMGYEYILCMNPYAGGAPGGSETLENPAIYGSHDMINWEPFTHFQNPLADSTDFVSSRSFLSDNVWFHDPLTGEILCIYRRFNVAIQRMYFEYRATTDGINWTEPRNIVMYDSNQETVGEWVSPMLAYNPEDGLYYMIVGQEYNFYLRTKKNLRDLNEPWSEPVDIQVPGWHGEIRVIGNRLYLFSCNVNHAPGFKIHRSADGDWTSPYELVREDFIDNAAFVAEYGNALTYKNTLVPHLYNDGTAQVKCIIQCRPNSSTWWLFYGETPRQSIVDA